MIKIEKDIYKALSNNPKRLLHVINVALVSKSISKKYNFDQDLSYLAGLMHDYSKHHSNTFHKEYIGEELFLKHQNATHLYHAISAAKYFKKHYQINDELYNAVKNHVYGMPDMDNLTKVLYIADSIYLNGKYNTRKLYKLALNNLDEAVYEISKYNIKSVERKGNVVSDKQLQTMKYYEEVSK